MSGLVLSIFPGLGLLDRAFEAEGFCVVRGPDVIWGGDVRDFHPTQDFRGVIGGDPCQAHSPLGNLVRAKGYDTFPDLTDEFLRIIDEARPQWFLRENVPQAPEIKHYGYGIHDFVLDHAALLDERTGTGHQQRRKRRFWFGVRGSARIRYDLRKYLDFAAFDHAQPMHSVTGAHTCHERPKGGHGERYTVAQMLELQGLPADFLDHCPLTVSGKRKAIGNGVPQAMGRALARAVREAVS